MVKVVCLKWGEKYAASYVNKLYKMVESHIGCQFEFYCLTEAPSGLRNEVRTIELPNLGLQGWWYKLLLFKDGFLPFSENDLVLYLDLDVVILNDLSPILFYDERLVISSDDSIDRMNSSVMCFKYNTLNFLWESFWEQSDYIVQHFHGDQDWIERIMPSAKILPKDLVCSFKIDLNSKTKWSFGSWGRFLRVLFPILLPKGHVERPSSAIVLFHGLPNPEDVMNGPYDKYKEAPWVKDCWFK